jgi:hypothetical protein
MSQREMNLLWLKDLIDHLRSLQQQLQWTEDTEAIRVLTEAMLRDLECCKRLCEFLHSRAQYKHTA